MEEAGPWGRVFGGLYLTLTLSCYSHFFLSTVMCAVMLYGWFSSSFLPDCCRYNVLAKHMRTVYDCCDKISQLKETNGRKGLFWLTVPRAQDAITIGRHGRKHQAWWQERVIWKWGVTISSKNWQILPRARLYPSPKITP